METFSVGVATGVTATFVGFALKEWATSVVHGIRIRKLLTTDIAEIIRGLRGHEPSLKPIEKQLANDEPSFIWDSLSNSQIPDYVTNAIYHLSSQETAQCWRFYDAVSRLDAIRDEYNGAVRALITEETKRELFRKIATSCLHDLQRHYADAISIGSNVLLTIQKSHLDIQIRVAEYKDDNSQLGNPE